MKTSIPAAIPVLVILPWLAASPCRATLVVDWHGNYVSQAVELQGRDSAITPLDYDNDGTVDDVIAGRAYSDSVPMNPTTGYDTGLGSAIFYGGAAAGHLNDTEGLVGHWDSFQVTNQGPNDDMHFKVRQGTHQHDLHLMAFWKKEDFLAPGAGFGVTLDASSSFFLDIHNANASMGDCIGRWLVRDGNQFYLSEATFTPSTGAHTLSSFASAGSDGNWAPFNPLGLNMNNTATSYASVKFTDVTAVGFHLEHDAFRDNYDFSVHQFTVNANVVPEPAAGALMLLGLLLLRPRRKA